MNKYVKIAIALVVCLTVGYSASLVTRPSVAEWYPKIEKPFFLSGGIGPDDAALVKKFKHPDFFGVDLNSLFEKEPGVKDMGLVLKFIHGLK